MELRESDFEEIVLKSDRPVLVDFWASWCPPCKMMQPVIEKLATKVGDWADVYSVNIDRNPSLAAKYQISGVPTFVSFASGESIDRKTGALTEGQLTGLLKKAQEAIQAVDDVDGSQSSPDNETEEWTLPHLSAIPEIGSTEMQEDREADASRSPEDEVSERTSLVDQPDSDSPRFITIVSGLPRSGTSLMMRMLNVGGIPALCDELRTPDADNPNGYYEFEDVKSIENYDRWIDRAPGHAVKMVYSLLKHLPTDREYRVVFMRRHVDEILQSQKAMLQRNGIETEIPDDLLKRLFERELKQFYAWLPTQPHLRLINVSYNELLSRPDSTISHINRHLDHSLDSEAMIQVIEPGLYRHRAA
jgi:thioredoxin